MLTMWIKSLKYQQVMDDVLSGTSQNKINGSSKTTDLAMQVCVDIITTETKRNSFFKKTNKIEMISEKNRCTILCFKQKTLKKTLKNS